VGLLNAGAVRRLRAAWALALLVVAMHATGQQVPAASGIVALQGMRTSESVALRDAAGRLGSLSLLQLNPVVNAWLLVTLAAPGGPAAQTFHLENADPSRQRVTLDPGAAGRLRIAAPDGEHRCALWPGDALARARSAQLAYAPLCEGRLYLRNAVRGNRSALEATTEFLRDHVWRGEQIVGFVRRELYRDAFIERGQPASQPAAGFAEPGAAPPVARLREPGAAPAVLPDSLAIDVGPRERGLALGHWAPAAGVAGVFVSVMQPGAAIAAAQLDPVEAQALAYLVAFDLGAFELGFALGTEHPRLGWSARVPPERRLPAWPGPDGFDSAAPLVRTGMLAPSLQARAVATFTGGFKREHGAFRSGALAGVSQGSHYGFVEQGVVFSRLVPGLSTLLVLDDGSVDMKTWRTNDDALAPRLRHARQNGVPLLERGASGEAGTIGPLVGQWGPGNWSGSADEALRTLRAGACLLAGGGRRFLVYGYFSSATPRAMAQTFQAYGCRYAMHLDMNALEHTYLALYPRQGAQIGVENLVDGMAVLDRQVGTALVPRFLGFADDRDFFYLLRKVGP
jgi:hypothetical protein